MIAPILLTPELHNQVVASIRAGGYPHVAAQAWGVPRWLFKRWLRKGRRAGAGEPYRSFYRQVEQARCQARLKAELAALDKDPRFWLKHGPGREQPRTPGWSAMVRATPRPHAAPPVNLLASTEVMEIFAAIRTVLAPHPEILTTVSQIIEKKVGQRRC